jgi:hypothetical protein
VAIAPSRRLGLLELYNHSDVHLNSSVLEEGALNRIFLAATRD